MLLVAWQASVMWLYYVGELLARWAARVSEHSADWAAADWGYGEQLAALYASIGAPQSDGLLARLLADHPPTRERIERLAAAEGR